MGCLLDLEVAGFTPGPWVPWPSLLTAASCCPVRAAAPGAGRQVGLRSAGVTRSHGVMASVSLGSGVKVGGCGGDGGPENQVAVPIPAARSARRRLCS